MSLKYQIWSIKKSKKNKQMIEYYKLINQDETKPAGIVEVLVSKI